MPPNNSRQAEKELAAAVESYLKGYTAGQREIAMRNHPSNYSEEVQPYGEYPDLPEM